MYAFDMTQDRSGKLTAKALKKALDVFGVSLSEHDVRAITRKVGEVDSLRIHLCPRVFTVVHVPFAVIVRREQ